MLCRGVATNGAQDEAPDNPVISVERVMRYCLLDLLDGLGHLALFEQGESPVSQAVLRCHAIRAMQLGRVANVYGLLVVLVHVVNKGQVVVGVRVLSIQLRADLEVLHGQTILLLLEVGQSQVVLQLPVVRFDLAGFLEGKACLVVEFHLVECDAEEEEGTARLAFELV